MLLYNDVCVVFMMFLSCCFISATAIIAGISSSTDGFLLMVTVG